MVKPKVPVSQNEETEGTSDKEMIVSILNPDGSLTEDSRHATHLSAVRRAREIAGKDAPWHRHHLGGRKYGNALVGPKKTAVISGY